MFTRIFEKIHFYFYINQNTFRKESRETFWYMSNVNIQINDPIPDSVSVICFPLETRVQDMLDTHSSTSISFDS